MEAACLLWGICELNCKEECKHNSLSLCPENQLLVLVLFYLALLV